MSYSETRRRVIAHRYVVGIDKGTSVVKAVAFGRDGRQVATARRRISSLHPQPGWHEENPELTWRQTCEAIRAVLAALPGDAEVCAAGVTGHMGGAWLVDQEGKPVCNAICWPDGRAHDCLAQLVADGRLERFVEVSGNAPMPGVTMMVLRYLSLHDPKTLARADHVLFGKDFVRLRLTGEIATDPSDVSWMPGDATTGAYSDQLLKLCGIPEVERLLPPILPSGAVAGRVTREAVATTGLAEGTPVITGLGDGPANAVGTGVINPDDAVTVLGTSCLNQLVVRDAELEPFGLGFLWMLPNGNRIRVLPNTAGTMSINWMLKTACPELFERNQFDEIERLASQSPPGAGGVVFVPYLNPGGVLAPVFDPLARGTLYGLTAQTEPAQMIRAAFEGLAFAVRDCYEAMPRELPDRIRVTGGGANSVLLCQLLADVTGRPTETITITESGAAGVAMLAAISSGLVEDLDHAAASWCRAEHIYEPDIAQSKRLESAYQLYRAVRDATLSISSLRQQVEEGLTADKGTSV